jgi:hypothetical protein
MGVDSTTHRIYLPTAEAGSEAAGGAAKKPGAFEIVVNAGKHGGGHDIIAASMTKRTRRHCHHLHLPPCRTFLASIFPNGITSCWRAR